MGDKKTAAQSLQRGCKRDAVPIFPEESDDNESPEEFKIYGQSLRPGPLPILRPRKSTVNHDLSEMDGAPVRLNDAEATQFGPLTEKALESERKKSQLDPRHPCRPLCMLPVGQIESDSPEFKAFRKYALDHNVMIKLVANPKQLFRRTAQRVTTQRLSLSFVGLDVSRLGMFEFPPQDAYHLLQHRLSVAQRNKLRPATIATLALLIPLDLKVLLLKRHSAAPLSTSTLPMLVNGRQNSGTVTSKRLQTRYSVYITERER